MTSRVVRICEVKLLAQAGLLPVLVHCVLCGTTDLDQVSFSPKQGGVVCKQCSLSETGTVRIAQGTIQSLLFFLRSAPAQAAKLQLGLQTERELERIIEKFLQSRLDYPLKSPRFLAELRPLLKNM